MRTYTERDICKLLGYIEDGTILDTKHMAEWARMFVLPHLWGRNLIEWQAGVNDKRRWPWQPKTRRILVLTKFGEAEMAAYRLEEAQALIDLWHPEKVQS